MKKSTKRPAAKNGLLEAADVLTLAEAAAYLRVSEDDVVNTVNFQGLPGKQIAGAWRFLRSSLQEVENWAD